MIFNYIIYHKNCYDGFTGLLLFLFTKQFEVGKTIIYPDVPYTQNIPPNITGKNIIIIDVAYNIVILNKIIDLANNIYFIDHHISIEQDIKDIKNNKVNIIFDINESGTSLVWKHFFKGKIPKFIKYIKLNDIGQWTNKNVLYFATYMEAMIDPTPSIKNFSKMIKFFNNDFLKKCVKIGKYFYTYKLFIIKNYAKKARIKVFPSKFVLNEYKLDKQYNVAVINGGCPNVSLLGNYICNNYDCDFCILWTYDYNNYIISMRSTKIDISNIAHIFGGGGHKYAATFHWNDDINILFETK